MVSLFTTTTRKPLADNASALTWACVRLDWSLGRLSRTVIQVPRDSEVTPAPVGLAEVVVRGGALVLGAAGPAVAVGSVPAIVVVTGSTFKAGSA